MGTKNSLVGGDMLETGAGIAASKTIIGSIVAAKAFKLMGGVPFIIMAAGASPKVNKIRILEAVIIAVITALITGGATAYVTTYSNQKTIGVKIDVMSEKITGLEKTVDDIRHDFYAPKFREFK